MKFNVIHNIGLLPALTYWHILQLRLRNVMVNKILACFILVVSASAYAQQPECVRIDPQSCGNNGLIIAAEANQVPEPGTLALLSLGITGLIFAHKRRK
jgi:hypothetical protein